MQSWNLNVENEAEISMLSENYFFKNTRVFLWIISIFSSPLNSVLPF
jgi:hypothetical protein